MIEKNGQTPRDTAGQLERDPGSFSRFFQLVLKGKPEWAELLLFIDQFEELFTLVDKNIRDLLSTFWPWRRRRHACARC